MFDQEFLVQARHLDFVIKEVPVPTKYFPEASNASFVDSTIYGLSILLLLGRYFMHSVCHVDLRQFQSFQADTGECSEPRRTCPIPSMNSSLSNTAAIIGF